MTDYFIIPGIIFSFHTTLILSILAMYHTPSKMHAGDEVIMIGFNREMCNAIPDSDECCTKTAQRQFHLMSL